MRLGILVDVHQVNSISGALPMKLTALTAIALTTTLTLFVPIAQAESLGLRFSDGQPDSTFYPFGRSSEAVDGNAFSNVVL